MIQAFSGAIPPGMARHHSHQIQERLQAEANAPDPGRSWGRVKFEGSVHETDAPPKSARPTDQDQGRLGHRDRGHARFRFGDVVSSAVFADRARMEQRAEFRGEMHDIRSGIRDLIGEVDGGVLTPEQQQTFDGFVKDIVELRDSYDFKHWRSADADMISARILDRFGIERTSTSDSDTEYPFAPAADRIDKLLSTAERLESSLPFNEGSAERLAEIRASAKRMAQINADIERVAQSMAEVLATAKRSAHIIPVHPALAGYAALAEAAPESVNTVLVQQPPILVQDAAPTDGMAAMFADRARIGQRAEFRAEMHDIRRGIRDLMGKVDGGILTPEQQQKFDGFVKEIVDLRESYDFKHWRSTDVDVISARILDRFGVERPSTSDSDAKDELIAMAEKLAGVIADASDMMDDLMESLGG